MKKIYFSILSLVCAAGLNAQITINQNNHAPNNGDQYGMFQIDSNTVSKGPDGASVNWNFMSINTHSSLIQNYTVSAVTNSLWPNANLGVTSSTAPGSFYSASSTDLKFWGGMLSLGGVSAELKFSSPAVYMAYPTSFNGSTVSAIAGSIAALSQSGVFVGNCTVSALATGTMVLPAKTFSNVIRVTTSVSISFTAGLPGTANQVTDDFYSLGDSRYPILSMNSSTLSGLGTSIQRYAYVQKNYHLVGVNEGIPSNTSLSIFPVPAVNTVNFVADNQAAAQVMIFDVTGKNIDNRKLENGKLQLNTSEFANGLYIYRITDGAGRSMKTGRFTVEH